MGSYSTYSKEDLEALKGHYYDDWNFGSGKQSSLDALEAIEAELKAREGPLGALMTGVTWHASDTPPDKPNIGDAFWDTELNTAFVWTGNEWTPFAAPGKL